MLFICSGTVYAQDYTPDDIRTITYHKNGKRYTKTYKVQHPGWVTQMKADEKVYQAEMTRLSLAQGMVPCCKSKNNAYFTAMAKTIKYKSAITYKVYNKN